MLMLSSSSTPADLAMAVIKDDEIKKILPALAMGAFGAYGAYTGAGGKVYDPETGEWFVNPWDEGAGNAKAVDPLTGGLLAEKELGTSTGDRILGGAVGATQAINPFSYLKLGGRAGAAGIRAGGGQVSRLGGKLPAGGGVAARNERLAHEAGSLAARDTVTAGLPDVLAAERLAMTPDAFGGTRHFSQRMAAQNASRLDDEATLARNLAYENFSPTFGQKVGGLPAAGYDKVVGAPGRALTRWGDEAQKVGTKPFSQTHPWYNRMGSAAGRGLQVSPEVMALIAGAGAMGAMEGGNVDISQDTGGGYGSTPSAQGGYGAGGLDYNMGNVGQGYTQGTPEKQIWTGQMEQQRGSGYGHQPQQIQTGENMKIGQQLLKEAKEDMDKPKDDKDAKGKKGGMILIIGHGGKPPKGDDKSKDDTE